MAGELTGDDFNAGVAVADFADGAMRRGHADGEAVLMVRQGSAFFAIGADCSHYGGPLEKGMVMDGAVRCPWHHACFSLRSGEALQAPALDAVTAWEVEQRDGRVFTRGKRRPDAVAAGGDVPESVVIIGGGAAGEAAAEMLRRRGYEGRVTVLSEAGTLPPDRTTLSKGYLSGAAGIETVPLREAGFFVDHGIDLVLGVRVGRIDVAGKLVELSDGVEHRYGALLIATGAAPATLHVPGGERIRYLRGVADAEALSEAAAGARVVVIGSSFIGMEVAASLRKRDIDVVVVSQEAVPMESVLGPELGGFFRALHEDHGVVFHMGAKIAAVTERAVVLEDGRRIPADVVVAGIGVAPLTDLAEAAGLAVDDGVVVDAGLQSSVPGIYAAGDIARWPDPHSGQAIRVEHWVVAQRQGQVAARNMLGEQVRFDDVPFFWTGQYDVSLRYVGHAKDWDEVVIDGALAEGECTVTYRRGGEALAMATLKRDRAALEFVAARGGH